MARDNRWMTRRVIGFAHQGGAAEGPPSTIETMHRARDNGASALEFDLHRTRDGALVLNHDKTLEIQGEEQRIAGKTLGELRALKPDLAELDEVLAEFPGVPLTVEIKRLRAAWRAGRVLDDEASRRPIIVTAFNPANVLVARLAGRRLDLAPGMVVMAAFWLVSRLGLSMPVSRRHVALQVPIRFGQVIGLKRIKRLRPVLVADQKLLVAAHRRRLAVHVWTVDEESDMDLLLDEGEGPDGFFTDRPTVLTRALKRHHVHWMEDTDASGLAQQEGEG